METELAQVVAQAGTTGVLAYLVLRRLDAVTLRLDVVSERMLDIMAKLAKPPRRPPKAR